MLLGAVNHPDPMEPGSPNTVLLVLYLTARLAAANEPAE